MKHFDIDIKPPDKTDALITLLKPCGERYDIVKHLSGFN